jgi:hypothetical protein
MIAFGSRPLIMISITDPTFNESSIAILIFRMTSSPDSELLV